ncbi:MAG: J domain-containing protein [Pyrinomonadaceae bacterium]
MSQAEREPDHYATLGVERDAPQREIERRYKRLAAEHHPDRGGDEERMKSLNEAYRVLRDDTRRAAYNATRPQAAPTFVPTTSPSATADALWGRMAGALLCIFGGTVLICLVRFQYVVFLWPLALLGLALMSFGVWMAHAALAYARASYAPTHLARRTALLQETAFWSAVVGGFYGLYLLLTTL